MEDIRRFRKCVDFCVLLERFARLSIVGQEEEGPHRPSSVKSTGRQLLEVVVAFEAAH